MLEPFEHLEAETLAFLFASEEAFGLSLTHIDPQSQQVKEAWRSLERRLTPLAQGLSLEGMLALRDRMWYGAPRDNQATLLTCVLTRIGQEYLRAAGPEARLKYKPNSTCDDIDIALRRCLSGRALRRAGNLMAPREPSAQICDARGADRRDVDVAGERATREVQSIGRTCARSSASA